MEAIRVYVPKAGKWSKSIIGVDKSFFIEGLVRVVANQVIKFGKEIPNVLPIELNFAKPLVDEFIKGVYYEDFIDPESGEVVSIERYTSLTNHSWSKLKFDWKKLEIPQIQSVMVSIGVLKKFVTILHEEYSYIAPAVQEIIDRAELTSLGVSDDYKVIIQLNGK